MHPSINASFWFRPICGDFQYALKEVLTIQFRTLSIVKYACVTGMNRRALTIPLKNNPQSIQSEKVVDNLKVF